MDCWNRKVLSWRLKPCSESESVMFAGRLFQVTDAAYENDRLAKSVVSLGMVSRGSAASRLTSGRTWDQVFLQVDWNTGRTCSARQHRRLVHDALAYRKPVKLSLIHI